MYLLSCTERSNMMNRLKYIIFSVLLAIICMVVVMGSSLAAVKTNDICLGGIYPGMTYQEVTAIYGPPEREERGYAQLVHKVIFYGDNVEIGFCGEKVLYVTVTANNGWKSPQGLHAGMDLNEAKRINGEDYKCFRSQNVQNEQDKHSPFFDIRWRGLRYVYRCTAPEGVYAFEPGDTKWEIDLMTRGEEATQVEAVSIRAYLPEN